MKKLILSLLIFCSVLLQAQIQIPQVVGLPAALSGKEAKLPSTPSNPESRFLNGNRQWAEIVLGSGGYASNVYFTNLTSTIVGTYKQTSGVNDVAETIASGTCNNNEVLIHTYLFEQPVGITTIDAGVWRITLNSVIDAAAGDSKFKFVQYKRSAAGVETDMFTVYSNTIENRVGYEGYLNNVFETVQPSFVVDATDRLGCRIYATTTAAGSRTLSYKVGDGFASYLNTPLVPRHDQFRDKNGNPLYQHLTSTQVAKVDATSGTNTGDETLTSIKTKLGAATSVSDGYLKYQDYVKFDGKLSSEVDGSTTNELQTISTSGAAGNITLSNSGGTLNLNVNDADASTTNEIQDLSLSGNTLTLSSDATTVDISQSTAVQANTAKVSNATHTGDVTGSTALTLATVNSNVGTFNNVTINAKGLATAGSNVSYEPSFSKNTAFNKNFGTTTGTVLEGRTFGTAANSAVGDFIQNQNSSAQSANMWIKGLSDIPMLVGENYTSNSSDAQIVINRNVDDVNGDGAGYNAHAFSDSSPITRSGGISYNSFDGRVNYSGTANYGHNATFQSAPTFGSSGTITDLYNFISAPTVNTGIATNNYGFYLSDPVGTGTVVNNYGVYIPQLSKGSTKNFAIYTHGSTKNYMGGRTQIGSDISGYTTLLNLYGTASDLAVLSMRPYAAGDDVGIRLYSNSGTPYGVLSGSDATGIIKIGGVSENFFLTFWAGNLERVRVDKGGNVGIGYTTETPITNNKLAVNGTGFFSGNVTASSFSGNGSNITGIQLPITLTTNGTSGAATFSGNVLNVPNYTSNATGGTYSPTITLLSGLASKSTPLALYTNVGSVKHAALSGTVTTNTTGTCSFRFTLPSSILGYNSIFHVYVFGHTGAYVADAYVTDYGSDSNVDLYFNSTSPSGSTFTYSIMVDYD